MEHLGMKAWHSNDAESVLSLHTHTDGCSAHIGYFKLASRVCSSILLTTTKERAVSRITSASVTMRHELFLGTTTLSLYERTWFLHWKRRCRTCLLKGPCRRQLMSIAIVRATNLCAASEDHASPLWAERANIPSGRMEPASACSTFKRTTKVTQNWTKGF